MLDDRQATYSTKNTAIQNIYSWLSVEKLQNLGPILRSYPNMILCPHVANAQTLAFYLEAFKGDNHHCLFSSVNGVVAVGAVGIVGWIIWRNHATIGSCEVCAAS